MFNKFKEITDFFKQKKFTQTELDSLKKELEIKYPEKEILKAAFSLINLELVKFQLTFFDNLEKEIQDISLDIKILTKKNTGIKKTNKYNTHLSNIQFNKKPFIEQVKNKSINEIAQIIRTMSISIIKAFEKKNIIKQSSDNVSEEELISISEYLKARITKYNNQEKKRQKRKNKILLYNKTKGKKEKTRKTKTKLNKKQERRIEVLKERQKKRNKEINRIINEFSKKQKHTKASIDNSVYDKLQAYGGPGKLIYTRM